MKRLAGMTIGAAATLAAFASPALAEGLPLTSATPSNAVSALTSTVGQVTAPVTQTAAPVLPALADSTTGLDQTKTPVDRVARVLPPAVATVARSAGRVVAPLTETAAPILKPVVDPVAKVAPPVDDAAAALGVQVGATKPAAAVLAPSGTEAVVGHASSPISVGSGELAPAGGPRATATTAHWVDSSPGGAELPALGLRGAPSAFIPPSAPSAGPSGVVASEWTPTLTSPHAAKGSADTRSPAPSGPRMPEGPLGFLGSASASAGSSALLLFAALAAIVALAAPRPGRRLRPGSAPWRLPIPQLSLERPG